MPSNERADGATNAPLLPTEVDDLAELVDDAAKALSIGGTQQADEDVRQVVDRLKQQLAEAETPAG